MDLKLRGVDDGHHERARTARGEFVSVGAWHRRMPPICVGSSHGLPSTSETSATARSVESVVADGRRVSAWPWAVV